MDNEYNLPEGTEILHDTLIKDCAKFPAVEGCKDIYILKNNEILCSARVGSSYNGQVLVYLENEEALEIFKNDIGVRILGKNAPFPFYEKTGWYVFGRFDEEDEERGVGLTIVDKFAFAFGIASEMRYSHIPGYGNKLKIG